MKYPVRNFRGALICLWSLFFLNPIQAQTVDSQIWESFQQITEITSLEKAFERDFPKITDSKIQEALAFRWATVLQLAGRDDEALLVLTQVPVPSPRLEKALLWLQLKAGQRILSWPDLGPGEDFLAKLYLKRLNETLTKDILPQEFERFGKLHPHFEPDAPFLWVWSGAGGASAKKALIQYFPDSLEYLILQNPEKVKLLVSPGDFTWP